MSGQKSTHVSAAKKKIVADLKELLKNKKTILISSIKNLPGAQFQEIVKKMRGKAIVKVPKKSLILRAIDESGNEELLKIKESIDADIAVLFSDVDSFELAGELLSKKSPAKAKAGQEAPEDIQVDAGPTDLMPGPAISELGSVGLQVEVKDGKLNIRQAKVIVKKGEVISSNAADIMNKLDIKPFSIGFTPLVAFDTKENKFYAEMNIDMEGTLADLKGAFGKALAFAVEIGYTSPDTITFLLGKAESQAKALESLKPAEDKPAKEKASEEGKEKVEKASADVPSKEGKTPSDKTDGEDK